MRVGRWSRAVGGTLAALAVAGCTPPWAAAPSPAPDGVAVVDHVVDGDTVDVVIAGRVERVRLIGIDTPEIEHPASSGRPASPGECYGAEAHDFLRALLPVGAAVRLERDVVARDDYGRLLGYVHRVADEMFVNLELVRRGYATPLSIAPNVTFRDRFVEAARRAERDDLGLWGACRRAG